MGLFDFVKSEVRQMAIARPDNVKHLIVYKHPDETIPKWAQLTVDSDEGAVFFKDGRVHGILGAGRHTLDAAMYPFLTGLVDKFGGGDVFKSEIFFVRTQPLRNDPVKFGAQVSMTDPVTQMPCTPMIHGEIVVRVMDPVKFIIGLTGQGHQALDNDVICEYISKKFRSGVRQALATILKQAQTCILEYDVERDRINDGFKARSSVPDFEEIGIQITEIVDFMVKLKPEDRARIDKMWQVMKVKVLEARAELELKKVALEARKMEIEVDVAERQAYVNMAQNPAYMAHAQAEALMGAGQGMAKGGGGTNVANLGAQMAVGMGMAGMFQQGMQPVGMMAPQYQRVQPAPGGAVNCGSCGSPNPGGKFCSNCGSPLAPPQPQGGFCSNCGGQLAPGAKFCAGCGAPAGGPQGGPPQGGPPQGGPPPQGGYPQAQGGYPQAQGGYPPAQGHPAQGQGPQPVQGGYPQAPQGGYPQAPQGGYPQAPQGGGHYAGGYPPPGGPGNQGGSGGHGGQGPGGHGQGQ